MLDIHCFVGSFLLVLRGGYPPVVVLGPLIVVASFVFFSLILILCNIKSILFCSIAD